MRKTEADRVWARLKPVVEEFVRWTQSLENPRARRRLSGRKGLLKCPKCALNGDMPARGVLVFSGSAPCPSCGQDFSAPSGRKKKSGGQR